MMESLAKRRSLAWGRVSENVSFVLNTRCLLVLLLQVWLSAQWHHRHSPGSCWKCRPHVICAHIQVWEPSVKAIFVNGLFCCQKSKSYRNHGRKGCQMFQTQQKEMSLRKISRSGLPTCFLSWIFPLSCLEVALQLCFHPKVLGEWRSGGNCHL